jgi:hypothetical protein
MMSQTLGQRSRMAMISENEIKKDFPEISILGGRLGTGNQGTVCVRGTSLHTCRIKTCITVITNLN